MLVAAFFQFTAVHFADTLLGKANTFSNKLLLAIEMKFVSKFPKVHSQYILFLIYVNNKIVGNSIKLELQSISLAEINLLLEFNKIKRNISQFCANKDIRK